MPLNPGDKLGPYQIVAPIGAGGMGEVYRANDPRLNRDVAIKVSASQFSERFEREAKAIASLNHPHICQIYDVGANYLVMEFIEGTPLQGPLPLEQALLYGVQICDALDAAHKKNITHRDLKPANILVTASGVKLLDFGLAKTGTGSAAGTSVGGSGGAFEGATEAKDLTEAGMVLGTAAYMSPEQAKGEPADARSDIFSFGVVLYEMLSGRQAFWRKSAIETMAAIMRDEPAPLDAPSNLSAVVTRCLRKISASRFQSMGEVRTALEQSAAAGDEDHSSIAVLPFTNIGADKENEYFSDGLAEEILNALSQVEGLRVAARTSSFYFKGKATEISEIASKLRVANVLEGSVRRAGNRVRVTAQLVDVKNGFHLWSERYDREMEDIFEVQDEIARAITERLRVTLAAGAKRSTKNVEAYELYLKGLYYWHQRSPSTLNVAISCFEQAIKIDSQYALAYAGLTDCYGILRFYGWVSAEAGQPPAHAAMTQAMKLAPTLWQVNFSRAFYALYFERAWREAGPHFEKAIAINPRSSLAQIYYGLFLTTAGRLEEAVKQTTVASQLDPLSPFVHCLCTSVQMSMGRYAEAESFAQKALELQPDYLFGLWVRGLALCGLGRNDEAIELLDRAVTLSRAPIFLGLLGLGYGRAGRAEDANRLLRELEDRGSRGEYVAAFAPLAIYIGTGDVPAIRRALAKAIAEAAPPVTLRVTCGQFLQEYRSDPEIERLLFELYGW